MATDINQPDDGSSGVVAGGSYDLLRRRAANHADALELAAQQVDQRRVAAFGSVGLALASADRIATDLACVPRDIVRIGDVLLLGFNVDLEMSVQAPEDVLALYHAATSGAGAPSLVPIAADDDRNFLTEPEFRDEFDKLIRFYGKSRFSDVRVTQNQLLAVFQVGDRVDDVRVFRWTLTGDGAATRATFHDARGERDYTWPAPHDRQWSVATREDQRAGAHPVVSIHDEVFVGFRNGRLQLRVETGEGGSHAEIDEAVENSGQSLADLTVEHLSIDDLLVIKVHLYEEAPRTYVFSRRTRMGRRVDAAGSTSRMLPGGDGIVFPGGYHLTSTGTRTFDVDVDDMVFEEVIAAPNGEDLLYVFHRLRTGEYLLMPYNMVRREVAQVITCHGFSTFADGSMVLFRSQVVDAEPTKAHPVQWWTTPFADDSSGPARTDDAWVARVGNGDLVAGLGDLFDVVRLTRDDDPNERTWESIAASTRRVLDQHLWLADPEAAEVRHAANDILTTAGQLLDEYRQVARRRAAARQTLSKAETDVRQVLNIVSTAASADDVVAALGQLRRARGELSAVADVEAIDVERVGELAAEVDAGVATLSDRAVEVLSNPGAFLSLTSQIASIESAVADASTSAELDELGSRLAALSDNLDAVVDTVSALDGGDPTVRTTIVRSVADVTGAANRVDAQLQAKRRSLGAAEADEAFDAELALVEQTLTGAIAGAATPEECDAVLARLLVTIERLESRYGDNPEHSAGIAELRSTAHEVVGERRSALLDDRSRRATRIVDAATRLLATVTRRASEFDDDKEVAAFFATDQLTGRVRELADELDALHDAGRAAEVRDGLRGAAERARRRIRDKAALESDDGAVVLGGARLAPNTQPFEMVLSSRADDRGTERVLATVTGTDYTADVTDELAEFSDLLGRPYPSETPGRDGVSRSEYLAWAVIAAAERQPSGFAALLAETGRDGATADRCRAEAERRHGDGYQRGVHDEDAARIIRALAPALEAEPLLRFTGASRGLARLWQSSVADAERANWQARAVAASTALQRLGATSPRDRVVDDALSAITAFVDSAGPLATPWFSASDAALAAEYLVAEYASGADFSESSSAAGLVAALRADLGADGLHELEAALVGEPGVLDRFVLARDWVAAFVAVDEQRSDLRFDIDEAAVMLATPEVGSRAVNHAGAVTISGLVGDHARIDDGVLTTRTDELAGGAGRLFAEMSERWPRYQAARRTVVERQRDLVRIDDYRPDVMAGFVRNTLIDTALLPLFGPNLARQIGTVDPTDMARQGLLVVVSPPGYGKTTLMEWIADRLGLLIVKVNGPALGHGTTSLDPDDAPNAAARAEVEKINLAFRMGRNVMLYLDDIQHTSPELLSRFIPLADATRRIEGVVDGQPTTFDLRGKRFCVVMAGNPYTTGGGRFEMPDMLVNRSDVFNLGDVSGEHDKAFAMSYIENSLTACPPIAPHASKLLDDLGPVLDMADGRRPVEASGLEHAWDGSELDATVRSLALLRRAQRVLLQVNEAYIASAATSDDDRTTPPFLLQGSYRNMARIASRVVPVMTDDELDGVVDDHYSSEAQTLTDRAEQNLLAYRQLTGRASDDENARWNEIVTRAAARFAAADGVGRVVDAIDRVAKGLSDDR